MESIGFSRRLLSDIRQIALELQKLLTLSLTDGSDSCDFDSFTDLNPFPALTSTTAVTSLIEEVELPDMGANDSTQCQAIDLWKAESLVQYSILQSVCNVAEVIVCDAAEVTSGCWGLVTALKKLLELLSTGNLMKLCDNYDGVYQENIICEQNDSAKCIVLNEKLAQPFRTPGRSRCSDLNRTDVFEIVEKICEQAEDERKTLETELRKARYDLDRTRGDLFSWKCTPLNFSCILSPPSRTFFCVRSCSRLTCLVFCYKRLSSISITDINMMLLKLYFLFGCACTFNPNDRFSSFISICQFCYRFRALFLRRFQTFLESHEVSRKTITHIRTQLESENRRYACLEDSSSQVMCRW